MDYLIVVKGRDQSMQFDLVGDPITIGRGHSNIVRLTDGEVSRRHAVIRQTENGRVIEDLRSVNGLYVNGNRVQEAILSSGDQIQMGKTLLLYSVSADAHSQDEKDPHVDFAIENETPEPSRIIHSYKEEAGRDLFTPVASQTADAEWLKRAKAHLNLIYHTTLVVSQTLDIDSLLQRIMDMIFEWENINRGCIFLYNSETNKLVPKVSRRRYQDSKSPLVISQSIIDYVLAKKEGVLTDNSNPELSPEKMAGSGVKEAICVPMLGRYGLVGIIYIDITSENYKESSSAFRSLPILASKPEPLKILGVESVFIPPVKESEENSLPKFTVSKSGMNTFIKVDPEPDIFSRFQKPIYGSLTPDHLKLMCAIGHQAALAVEDTQYYVAMLQSERLAAVGQTVAVLSHHIKNILQGIQGGSYLIEKGLSGHDETMVGKGWGIVDKNQKKISDLILDMLTFSKKRNPVFKLKSIASVIEDVGELMTGRGREFNILVRLNHSAEIPKFYFDAEQIHRAVTNLVTNAIDAIRTSEPYLTEEEANETILPSSELLSSEKDQNMSALTTVREDKTKNLLEKAKADEKTEIKPDDLPVLKRFQGVVEIGTQFDAESKSVKIFVDDNGPGVPPSLREDLFRPFFSKNKSSGTGLGLAVTYKIVQEHKGNIDILDSPLGGARFMITLPFMENRPEEEEDS